MPTKGTLILLMIKTIVWGLDHPVVYPAFAQLQATSTLEIIAWFGSKELCPLCTHDISDVFQGEIGNEGYQGCPNSLFNEIHASLFTYMDMFSRRTYPYDDTLLHDYLNMFNIFVNYFYNLLKKNDVEIVFFVNLPHEGPDFILYTIAKYLGVKTVLFSQTLFPNKFFCLSAAQDYGIFASTLVQREVESISIEKKHEKSLFYMAGLDQKTVWQSWKEKAAMLFSQIRKLNRLSGKSREDVVSSAIRRLSRYNRAREYHKRLEADSTTRVNLTAKYVYFPLHLQPELTTTALGGVFADQLLAIERLSCLLPADWRIYVKENPKQDEFMRRKWFFDRLTAINSVTLVSPRFSTYDLIKNSQFVATVSGTAGWEAITGGKNALVFGKTWYMNLPGVFRYEDNFDFGTILTYEIDHRHLEQEFSLLMSKTGNGVVDPLYSTIVPDFDANKNINSLAEFLIKLAANQETFPRRQGAK